MGLVGYTRPEDVKDAVTFARYCQERIGIPIPTMARIKELGAVCKRFMAETPGASWGTLVRTVDFLANRGKRFATPIKVVTTGVGWAFAAGALPELYAKQTIVDAELEAAIEAALTVETEPAWRDRFHRSEGVEARRGVYLAWTQQSSRSLA